METYTLISYILTKHCSPDNSFIVLEINVADLDEVMDNFKLTIVGSSHNPPMIKKPGNLDELFKELITKLTTAIGNDVVFGSGGLENRACLFFSEKVHDKYELLTI